MRSYTEDEKQGAKVLLVLSWLYCSLSLYLGLWQILSDIFHAGFNFFTIPAGMFVLQYCYSFAYLFSGYNKGYKLIQICTFTAFGFKIINITILLIQFMKDSTKTQDINTMIAILIICTAPWAIHGAALLNCLRMDIVPPSQIR